MGGDSMLISNGVMNGKSCTLRMMTGGYDSFECPDEEGFETRAIHAGQDPDQWESGIVVPPIHMGTTFKQDGPAFTRKYVYGRIGNPTRNCLDTAIASLDNAKYALSVSSGLATITEVCALLKAGDHVICGDDLYGGTISHFRTIAKNQGLDVDFLDTTSVKKVENAIRTNTKLVWIESPTNPLLKVMDIPRLAGTIKSKSEDILLVVDNTFLTPYLQKPLSMGADIVVYSLSKYMNGHSDVIMGALTTNDEELYKRMAAIQHTMGLNPSPFDSYLVLRGLKTLAIRMDRHIENATKVAKFLAQQPLVEKVIYPGLKSHPQYLLAQKLWNGPSGMISFYIKGDLQTSSAFLKALKIFTLAVSLGGYESLAQLPTTMTHVSVPDQVKIDSGITDNLIRLSIGLESASDLIKDIDQALKVAAKTSGKVQISQL